MGTRWLAAALIAIGIALVGADAQAQGSATTSTPSADEVRARQVFEEARAAFAAADYEVALARFREAYELSARAELLYNVGLAADRLRRDEEALEAFERYLREMPEAQNRHEVERRVELLRAAIADRAAGGDRAPSGSGGDVTSEGWFWALVIGGAILVAGGVAVGVGVAATSTPQREPDLPGSVGGVVMVLRM